MYLTLKIYALKNGSGGKFYVSVFTTNKTFLKIKARKKTRGDFLKGELRSRYQNEK